MKNKKLLTGARKNKESLNTIIFPTLLITLILVGVFIMVLWTNLVIGIIEIALIFVLWRVRDISHSETINTLIIIVMVLLSLIGLYHILTAFGIISVNIFPQNLFQ